MQRELQVYDLLCKNPNHPSRLSVSQKRGKVAQTIMNYSVADAIASMGGDAVSGRTGDISAILPYGIAPGAKAVMRKEKKAAEEVRQGAG